MKVYIIADGDPNDEMDVLCCVSSQSDAERFVERYNKGRIGISKAFIQEYELDAVLDYLNSSTGRYSFFMARDGSLHDGPVWETEDYWGKEDKRNSSAFNPFSIIEDLNFFALYRLNPLKRQLRSPTNIANNYWRKANGRNENRRSRS